jgi:hypothetical protein
MGWQTGPMRRNNFNKLTGWPHAVRLIGAEGLHVHDLRHTGNTFAASSGAGLRDLMVRMGHDSERAALIYQHEARGADQRITGAIDAHVQAEKAKSSRNGGGDPGVVELAGQLDANCTATLNAPGNTKARVRTNVLAWAFTLERVTGIEPALSAWEVSADPCRSLGRR